MITSYSQLQSSLNNMAKECLIESANNIKAVIDGYLQDWYSDYSPAPGELGGYVRTYTFLHDCIVSDIVQRGNSLSTRIYIDKEILKNQYNVSSEYVDTMLENANKGIHGVEYARSGTKGVKFWDNAITNNIEQHSYEHILSEFIKFARKKGMTIGMSF